MFAAGESPRHNAASPASIPGDDSRVPYRTELFLDNQLLEATPGVSRRLHPAKKHLLNPVVRCERWCDGDYMQPYTTMYDEEEKLFKMWARAGSDSKSGYVGGNAAYMLYFTSTDGVHWDKPDLGVMEVAGRRDHNIVFTSDMVLKSPTALSYGPDKFVVPSTADGAAGQEGLLLGREQASASARRVGEVRRGGDRPGPSPRGAHRHVARRHSLVVRRRAVLADAARRFRRRGTTA